MTTLSEYLTAVGELVTGTYTLGDTEKTRAINKALAAHSKYRPRRVVEDVDGDGGADYDLADLTLWETDFSRVLQVEYPVDDTSVDPNILDPVHDWTVYEKPAGSVLRFLVDKPAATEDFRVTYTARHAFVADDSDPPESVSTVAASDEDAVQALAASFFCRMLAALFAQDGQPTLKLDGVDQASKRRDYETQAAKYRAEYNEHVGLGKNGEPAAACATSEWDVNYPGGADRLTHGRRYR